MPLNSDAFTAAKDVICCPVTLLNSTTPLSLSVTQIFPLLSKVSKAPALSALGAVSGVIAPPVLGSVSI